MGGAWQAEERTLLAKLALANYMMPLQTFAAKPWANVLRATNATKYYSENDVCYFQAALERVQCRDGVAAKLLNL